MQSMSQQSLYPGLNPQQIQMFPGLNQNNMPPGYPRNGQNKGFPLLNIYLISNVYFV